MCIDFLESMEINIAMDCRRVCRERQVKEHRESCTLDYLMELLHNILLDLCLRIAEMVIF